MERDDFAWGSFSKFVFNNEVKRDNVEYCRLLQNITSYDIIFYKKKLVSAKYI